MDATLIGGVLAFVGTIFGVALTAGLGIVQSRIEARHDLNALRREIYAQFLTALDVVRFRLEDARGLAPDQAWIPRTSASPEYEHAMTGVREAGRQLSAANSALRLVAKPDVDRAAHAVMTAEPAPQGGESRSTFFPGSSTLDRWLGNMKSAREQLIEAAHQELPGPSS